MSAPPMVITSYTTDRAAASGPHLVVIHADHDHSVALTPDGPGLVEVEDDAGRCITVGHWIDRRRVLGAADPVPARPPSS